MILDFDGKAGPVDASKTPFLGPASEWPLEDRLATHQSWRVTPAFEACAHAMATPRNWVSKVRSRADLLPHGDVGAPERVLSDIAFCAKSLPSSKNGARKRDWMRILRKLKLVGVCHMRLLASGDAERPLQVVPAVDLARYAGVAWRKGCSTASSSASRCRVITLQTW